MPGTSVSKPYPATYKDLLHNLVPYMKLDWSLPLLSLLQDYVNKSGLDARENYILYKAYALDIAMPLSHTFSQIGKDMEAFAGTSISDVRVRQLHDRAVYKLRGRILSKVFRESLYTLHKGLRNSHDTYGMPQVYRGQYVVYNLEELQEGQDYIVYFDQYIYGVQPDIRHVRITSGLQWTDACPWFSYEVLRGSNLQSSTRLFPADYGITAYSDGLWNHTRWLRSMSDEHNL